MNFVLVGKGTLTTFRPPVYRRQLALPAPRKVEAPTIETAKAYQEAFDYFSEHLFKPVLGQPLPKVMLTLSRKRGSAAFFAPETYKNVREGTPVSEISLVPEHTGRPLRDVLSSLVHEMAHLQDHLDGTSCKNGYHGRAWFRIMKSLGLPGKKGGRKGNSNYHVSHDIDPEGAYAKAFTAMPSRIGLPFVTAKPAGAPGEYRFTKQGKRALYECPGCDGKNKVRGPSGMNLKCLDHDEELVELGF